MRSRASSRRPSGARPERAPASTNGVCVGPATRRSSRVPSGRQLRLAGYSRHLARPTALPLSRRPVQNAFLSRLRLPAWSRRIGRRRHAVSVLLRPSKPFQARKSWDLFCRAKHGSYDVVVGSRRELTCEVPRGAERPDTGRVGDRAGPGPANKPWSGRASVDRDPMSSPERSPEGTQDCVLAFHLSALRDNTPRDDGTVRGPPCGPSVVPSREGAKDAEVVAKPRAWSLLDPECQRALRVHLGTPRPARGWDTGVVDRSDDCPESCHC